MFNIGHLIIQNSPNWAEGAPRYTRSAVEGGWVVWGWEGGGAGDFLKTSRSLLWNPIKHLSASCQLVMKRTERIFCMWLALGSYGALGKKKHNKTIMYVFIFFLHGWGYTMHSTKPGLPWKQITKHSLSLAVYLFFSLSLSLFVFPFSILCEHIHHLW